VSRDFRRERPSAFSLVEITIALGVASFCLLAIVGLLQTGLTSEKATIGQTAGGGIMSLVYSDLTATPLNVSSSPAFQISLSNQTLNTPQTIYFSESGDPTGNPGSAPTGESRFRATVGIQSPTNAHSPALARIVVTWPAQADPQPDQWAVKASGSVEVLTALDRH